MTRDGDDANSLKCSFCGKPQDQVKKLIGGGVHLVRPAPGRLPVMAYICNQCVNVCVEILEQEELGL